jgi:hypothetical protein
MFQDGGLGVDRGRDGKRDGGSGGARDDCALSVDAAGRFFDNAHVELLA